jgi:hypothetical protein
MGSVKCDNLAESNQERRVEQTMSKIKFLKKSRRNTVFLPVSVLISEAYLDLFLISQADRALKKRSLLIPRYPYSPLT